MLSPALEDPCIIDDDAESPSPVQDKTMALLNSSQRANVDKIRRSYVATSVSNKGQNGRNASISSNGRQSSTALLNKSGGGSINAFK